MTQLRPDAAAAAMGCSPHSGRRLEYDFEPFGFQVNEARLRGHPDWTPLNRDHLAVTFIPIDLDSGWLRVRRRGGRD